MPLGDRGDAVRVEQERLNALGAELDVDGVWGPLTQAAFEKYGSADGGTTATTGSASELLLPGNAMLWYNETSGEYWVVYEVPGVTVPGGTSEATFTAWLIESDADLEAVVGAGKTPIPSFSGSEQDFTDRGVIDLGGVDELRVDDLEGDPFDNWVEDMTTLARVQPWILDDDYLELVVQAMMERSDSRLSLEEIQGTNWWVDHSAGERAWMETFFSDPSTAQEMLEDNRVSMRLRLANAGISNASEELIDWMADRTTMGIWSLAKLDSQIAALADPYSVDVIDDELFEFLANEGTELDTTRQYEDTVRDLLQTWLGPSFGNWTDEQIAVKAGELRNNPDGKIEFVEGLKDQRMAMFPNYTDRNLSYQAIMQPWKSMTQSAWGVPVQETDEIFMKIVQMNDADEASKLMRSTGFDRGYDKVVNEFSNGIKAGMGSNVRGAV